MTSYFLAACACPHPASDLFVFLIRNTSPPQKKKEWKRGDEDVVVLLNNPIDGLAVVV